MDDRYCHNCGNLQLAESKYCSQCGSAVSIEQWHYFASNERVGPLSGERLHELCASNLIAPETLVWREGMADWVPILATEFSSYFTKLPHSSPIPVNNTFAWWLAVMPLLAAIAEIIFAFVIGANPASLWVATIVVHFVLCAQDGKVLRQDGHRPPALGWALVVPVYLFIRAARLRRVPSHALVWFACLLGSILVIGVSAYQEDSDDPASRAVQIVQNGILHDHPERTVGEAADAFFEFPEWQGFVADDGQDYVNLEGDASRDGQLVRVVLQFVVDAEQEAFWIHALEIEGEPQDEEMINVFVEALYEQDGDQGQVVQIQWAFPQPVSRQQVDFAALAG